MINTQYSNDNTIFHSSNNMCCTTSSSLMSNDFFMTYLLQTVAKTAAKPSKKRVRFSASTQQRQTSRLFKEELQELWYSTQDLKSFKKEAQYLAMEFHAGNISDRDQIRGLEGTSMERLIHRHQTIQCTVSAYQKGLSPAGVASVAQKCSSWNEEVAFIQACHDYCDVYQPADVSAEIPQVPSAPPAFPFELRKKRVSADSSCQSRRVRRRTQQ